MSAAERPWAGRRLHFVGVGGAGMSGYARAAHALGASVSGSDRADSVYLRRLREEGVLEPHVGHAAENVPSGQDVEVVYSSAVPKENPERLAARERGLTEHPRADLLGELTALRRTIAVAGAHGKTTTSAMIACALRELGADPSWLIGASIGAGLDNSHWGSGEWLVVEADESDRSMLSLNVEIAVLTNVELDHHATFHSLAELREAYGDFLALARRGIVVWDRPELVALAERAGAGSPSSLEIVRYDVPAPSLRADGCEFQWRDAPVKLAVTGAHNALNAAAALEAMRIAGFNVSARDRSDGAAARIGARKATAIEAIGSFGGAGRRFQRLGRTAAGALVIDDYAHHPTEVAATLKAARAVEHDRLVAVFQPHLYSRTSMLSREFGEALALADVTVVLDVYPARERAEDHPGVSGLTIARAAAEHAQGRTVFWLPTFDEAQRVLEGQLGSSDVCVAMGAGDVDSLARRLVERAA